MIKMTNNTINNRINKLRELMKERNIDYYIIPTGDPHGSEYIDAYFRTREFMSGFTGSAGTLLISMIEAVLFVDGRYHIQAEAECKDTDIKINKLGLEGVENCPQYLSSHAKKGETIGFYGGCLDESSFENIKNQLMEKQEIAYYIEEDLVDIIWSGQEIPPSETNNSEKATSSETSNSEKDAPNEISNSENATPSGCNKELTSDCCARPPRTANPVYKLPDDIIGTSSEEKLARVQEYIYKNSLDGVLISELSDICWLTNMRGSDIEYNPVMLAYLLVMKESITLFLQTQSTTKSSTNISNQDAATIIDASAPASIDTKNLNVQGGQVHESIETFNAAAPLAASVTLASYDELPLELAKLKGKRIGLDKNSTSCLNVKILECGNEICYVNNHDFIQKHIKDKKEIELCRKFHIEDAVAMLRFIRWIKAQDFSKTHITEYDAAMYLDGLRAKNEGFVSLSFETISAYGENAAIVHYSPNKNSSKALENRGLLLVDSGAQYMGATTDITRTISLGQLTQEEKTNYTLVLKGNLRLMNAIFVKGSRGENLDILAREPLWQKGLDYLHGTGHGIGAFLNVHEGPCSIRFRINNKNPQPALLPGMILSDEPGVYIAGKHGIRHETQLLVVEKYANEYGKFYGFEPMSLVPFEIESIVPELLTGEEKDILNRYHKLCYDKVSPFLTEEEKNWLKSATGPVL